MHSIRIGGIALEFLHSKDDTAGSLDLFHMTVLPKAKVPVPHYHESWEETVYGLSGTLTFRVGGTDHAIAPGRSTFIPRGVVHSFRNESEEPATALCILTPGVLGPTYFREIADLLGSGGPPDPEKVKEIMLRYGLVPVLG